jgi:hypothetical protein
MKMMWFTSHPDQESFFRVTGQPQIPHQARKQQVPPERLQPQGLFC